MGEQSEARRVPIERLSGFIERALAAVGMPGADARIVAALMAEADALGSDGHGVFRLPHYVRRIKAGGINLRPRIRIERERAGMALLDGDNAMGHLVMRARRRARDRRRRPRRASPGSAPITATTPGRPRCTRASRSRAT